jgi:hypothetical protein
MLSAPFDSVDSFDSFRSASWDDWTPAVFPTAANRDGVLADATAADGFADTPGVCSSVPIPPLRSIDTAPITVHKPRTAKPTRVVTLLRLSCFVVVFVVMILLLFGC